MAGEEIAERIESGSPGGAEKSKEEMLAEEIQTGLDELERSTSGLFLSAFSAGLDIGFGPLFMAVLLTFAGDAWSEPILRIAVANAYALGFVFVIGGRSELFTEHTTRATLPYLDGRASAKQVGRLWALVYAGNVLGGVVFAAGTVFFGPAYGITTPSAFVEIATNLTSHEPWQILSASLIAGWMMGMLSWIFTAAKDSMARIVVVWLITFSIGLAHLPHSIAGNIEVLMGTLVSPALGIADYVGFLVLATVGNAVGGTVFVALLKYGHVIRSD